MNYLEDILDTNIIGIYTSTNISDTGQLSYPTNTSTNAGRKSSVSTAARASVVADPSSSRSTSIRRMSTPRQASARAAARSSISPSVATARPSYTTPTRPTSATRRNRESCSFISGTARQAASDLSAGQYQSGTGSMSSPVKQPPRKSVLISRNSVNIDLDESENPWDEYIKAHVTTTSVIHPCDVLARENEQKYGDISRVPRLSVDDYLKRTICRPVRYKDDQEIVDDIEGPNQGPWFAFDGETQLSRYWFPGGCTIACLNVNFLKTFEALMNFNDWSESQQEKLIEGFSKKGIDQIDVIKALRVIALLRKDTSMIISTDDADLDLYTDEGGTVIVQSLPNADNEMVQELALKLYRLPHAVFYVDSSKYITDKKQLQKLYDIGQNRLKITINWDELTKRYGAKPGEGQLEAMKRQIQAKARGTAIVELANHRARMKNPPLNVVGGIRSNSYSRRKNRSVADGRSSIRSYTSTGASVRPSTASIRLSTGASIKPSTTSIRPSIAAAARRSVGSTQRPLTGPGASQPRSSVITANQPSTMLNASRTKIPLPKNSAVQTRN